jgi:hypothetical protein
MQSVKKLRAGGHDYAGAKAAEIFAWCREQKPGFDAICERVAGHAHHV